MMEFRSSKTFLTIFLDFLRFFQDLLSNPILYQLSIILNTGIVFTIDSYFKFTGSLRNFRVKCLIMVSEAIARLIINPRVIDKL